MFLFIDTSTRFGAVGLWSPADGTFLRVAAWWSRHNHTAELMPAVQRVVGDDRAALSGVGVTQGPGGFSALRAGLGVAKGLAFALSVPIVGVSTLEASAIPYRNVGWPVTSLLEAGRGLVAWARFRQADDGWRRLTPDRVTPLDQAVGRGGRHTLFCGEAVATHRAALVAAMGSRAHFIDEPSPLSRLHGLALLAAPRLASGDGDSVAALRPRYLRPPGITRPNAPRPVRYGAAPAG